MSWQRVNETYMRRFNKNLITCELTYERDFIINTIISEFPDYNIGIVTAAVLHCCRMISEPRPRELYFEMVKRIIINHINAEKIQNKK